jgi:hypothetical protein
MDEEPASATQNGGGGPHEVEGRCAACPPHRWRGLLIRHATGGRPATGQAPVHIGGDGGSGVQAGGRVVDWQSSRAHPRAPRHGLRSRSPACHTMAVGPSLTSIARLKGAPTMAACRPLQAIARGKQVPEHSLDGTRGLADLP